MDAGPRWRTLTGVRVDPVSACGTVLALVSFAVIFVSLAELSGKADRTVAVLNVTVELVGVTSTTVTTRTGLTGNVD